MYKPESQTTPSEAEKADGLSYDAYRAARERFFAHLLADSQMRRLESRPGSCARTSPSTCSGPADAADSSSGRTHLGPSPPSPS